MAKAMARCGFCPEYVRRGIMLTDKAAHLEIADPPLASLEALEDDMPAILLMRDFPVALP